jgi:hypothetical protein
MCRISQATTLVFNSRTGSTFTGVEWFVTKALSSSFFYSKQGLTKNSIFLNIHAKMLNFCEHDHHKIMNHFDIQGLLYIPKEDDLKI